MIVSPSTFEREVERRISDADERKRLIAQFANCRTDDEREAAFRKLRGGSMTKVHSTKLGTYQSK